MLLFLKLKEKKKRHKKTQKKERFTNATFVRVNSYITSSCFSPPLTLSFSAVHNTGLEEAGSQCAQAMGGLRKYPALHIRIGRRRRRSGPGPLRDDGGTNGGILYFFFIPHPLGSFPPSLSHARTHAKCTRERTLKNILQTKAREGTVLGREKNPNLLLYSGREHSHSSCHLELEH